MALLGRLFGGSQSDAVLGVDVGTSTIKIVQLRKDRGKLVLDTYGEIALGPFAERPIGAAVPFDPDIVSNALLQLLHDTNVSTKTAYIGIPSSASLVFVLNLPESALNSLKEIVPLESRKYIPVPINEVSLDWMEIPVFIRPNENDASRGDDGEFMREVLVAATRIDALSLYTSMSAQVTLEAQQYEIETFSALRAVLTRELSPVALVDIGASRVRVAIVHYGVIRTFHTMSRGGVQLTENLARVIDVPFEKAEHIKRSEGLQSGREPVIRTLRSGAEGIVAEIQNTVLQFERTYHKAVTKVVLSGGGARMIGLPELVHQMMSIDVELADPFSRASNPEFLNPVLQANGPDFTVAFGLALRGFE